MLPLFKRRFWTLAGVSIKQAREITRVLALLNGVATPARRVRWGIGRSVGGYQFRGDDREYFGPVPEWRADDSALVLRAQGAELLWAQSVTQYPTVA